MNITSFEFKAKVAYVELYEKMLLDLNPVFIGIDYQKDTYFNVVIGRLKLREGNIENALINYQRADNASAKESQIILYQHQPNHALKAILTLQLGVKVVVEKKRKIYTLDNVKFHFDEVTNLGTFIEVEALDTENQFDINTLKTQCQQYFDMFGLIDADLVKDSYSDLILLCDSKY
jgi:predicted adenylyl cyclase CyaB